MKECLKSKHHDKWLKAWKAFIKGYQSKSKESEEILTRLKTVEARGRYKKAD
jgi:tRNA A-37 threonylcarbamoyl transferase component Bud32